jgi:hypothetical protein
MKLLNIINKRAEILSHIDPDRIYVENIRSFFNIPFPLAKYYCNMAVKQNFFAKKFGIVCPNDDCRRIVLTVNRLSDIPKRVKCEHCELLERDNYEFSPHEKDIITFYQLIKKKQ